MQNRFSTLYFIVGKQGELGGIQFGMSLTDIRTKKGMRQFFDNQRGYSVWEEIPEMKKSYYAPFGGIIITANKSTMIMAEIQSIHLFDYNPKMKKMEISKAWLGIGGVRFFITQWLSMDTGVRYQSDFEGIADAKINIGANFVIPVKSIFKQTR